MATETALADAVRELVQLTRDVAAQSGYLEPEALVDTYQRNEVLRGAGLGVETELTAGQVVIARRLVAQREQAAADAADRQEQADRDEALAAHVARLEQAIAAEESVLWATLTVAKARDQVDQAKDAQAQINELDALRELAIAGKLAEKVQNHQRLAGIGFVAAGPVFERLWSATKAA